MSYRKAAHILPAELLEVIQEYVDGEYIYIPRKTNEKKTWGSATSFHREMLKRNSEIYRDYQLGESMIEISKNYYLSLKSVQRIILQEKRREM